MGRRKRKKAVKKVSLIEAVLFAVFKWFIGIIFILTIIKEILSSLFGFLASLETIEWLYVFLTIGILFLLYWMAKQHEQRIRAEHRYNRQIQLEELKRKQLQRIREKNSLEHLKRMDPFEFEHFIKELFEMRGYNATVTPRSNDGGKDIVLIMGDKKSIVECKRFNSPKVTRPHIQKFHSAIIDTMSVKGFFITTGEFTKPAVTYCLDKPIVLINGEELVKLVQEIISQSDSETANRLIFHFEPI
jgi:HJR/Mrr/RecB family endonuclease